jgi:hypothetical protein
MFLHGELPVKLRTTDSYGDHAENSIGICFKLFGQALTLTLILELLQHVSVHSLRCALVNIVILAMSKGDFYRHILRFLG